MKVVEALGRPDLVNAIEACAISASDTSVNAETPGPDWDPAPVATDPTASGDDAGFPRAPECHRIDAALT
jgi:hypothetical protein